MLLLVKWQHTANRRACFVMSRFVYLSFFFSPSDISRSQAQQGPEALPQPEVSEVFPRPRAAEDHPSQSVSPCCALWVQKYKRWQDCECGCWNQDIWLTNAVFKHHFFSFTLMTHFLLASFSLVSSPAHLISLPLDSPVNDHTLIPLKKKNLTSFFLSQMKKSMKECTFLQFCCHVSVSCHSSVSRRAEHHFCSCLTSLWNIQKAWLEPNTQRRAKLHSWARLRHEQLHVRSGDTVQL